MANLCATMAAELGLNPNKIYWTDSKNVELYNNKGIIRQNGNTLLFELPEAENVTAMCAMETGGNYKLVITTASGKIYIYSEADDILTTLNKTIKGSKVIMTPFLSGMVVATDSDAMFYIKNNSTYDIVNCNAKDTANNTLYPEYVTIYKGRIWCCKGATLYYSALGSYNDFSSANDAGYINEFHTDTSDIVTMCTYKDYLAIYKRSKVYLLSGSSPEDFALTLFADKGAFAKRGILSVDNKQFFLSDGIYALEQVGELNQIRLGSEISLKIREEFKAFDSAQIHNSFVVHNPSKHQVWYFLPYPNTQYYHTIWINDYLNHAWYKRIVPQNITNACYLKEYILSVDIDGKFYREDYGNTFNGTAIDFMWKSPFLSLGNVLHRKLVDEFYFVLDDVKDNNFQFSIYKDYDSEYPEDAEFICSRHYSHFIWAGDNTPDNAQFCWALENSTFPIWPVTTNVLEKAEICGSNFSIQICIEGRDITDNCAILGLQFREIYNDD